MTPPNKVMALEAIRGLAAWIVVAYHCIWGLMPPVFHDIGANAYSGLAGVAIRGLTNGPGAVYLFFVLSGFVLAFGLLQANDGGRRLLKGVVSRYPRLVGLVFVVTVAGGVCKAAGLLDNAEAGRLVGSQWLADFYAWTSRGWGEIPVAIAEGSHRVFLAGEHFYNPVTWSLYWELIGSMLVFALVYVLTSVRSRGLCAALLLGLGAWLLVDIPNLTPFVAGTALAYGCVAVRQRRHRIFLPVRMVGAAGLIPPAFVGVGHRWLAGAAAMISFALGLALFSNSIPTKTYAFHIGIEGPWLMQVVVLGYTLAAMLLIAPAVMWAPLSQALSGRWARSLGNISFAVYLTHFLIMCTLGSTALVLADGLVGRFWAVAIAVTVTVAVTYGVSVVLARFDAWWVRQVRLGTDRALDLAAQLVTEAQRLLRARPAQPPVREPALAVPPPLAAPRTK